MYANFNCNDYRHPESMKLEYVLHFMNYTLPFKQSIFDLNLYNNMVVRINKKICIEIVFFLYCSHFTSYQNNYKEYHVAF
jgi:hypothetical protein